MKAVAEEEKVVVVGGSYERRILGGGVKERNSCSRVKIGCASESRRGMRGWRQGPGEEQYSSCCRCSSRRRTKRKKKNERTKVRRPHPAPFRRKILQALFRGHYPRGESKYP